MTSYVIVHPDAKVLVDPAYCRNATERALNELSGILRAVVTPPSNTVVTVDLLHSCGLRPRCRRTRTGIRCADY